MANEDMAVGHKPDYHDKSAMIHFDNRQIMMDCPHDVGILTLPALSIKVSNVIVRPICDSSQFKVSVHVTRNLAIINVDLSEFQRNVEVVHRYPGARVARTNRLP